MTARSNLIKPNDWVYVPTYSPLPYQCKKKKSTGKLFIQLSDDPNHILEFQMSYSDVIEGLKLKLVQLYKNVGGKV